MLALLTEALILYFPTHFQALIFALNDGKLYVNRCFIRLGLVQAAV